MKWRKASIMMLAGFFALASASLQADVFNMGPGLTSLDMVPVGNAGNAGELSGAGAGGYGPNAIVGGVAYTYQIGKFEVTAGHYAEFLNKVAATDTYGLYSTGMAGTYGCGIQRSGSSGTYTYSVGSDWANRPVNYVSWGDAARFANWLHNGQPTGAQGISTTEDGSYYLNGATTQAALMAVTRKTGATWVIPTEDEWYKAAYHKNDGVTGNYWDYPTGTNAVPNNANPEGDTGNTANYGDGDYTVGSPYYTTPVGNFGLSDSPCGTFDQGGNVWEWTETEIVAGSSRAIRGGDWRGDSRNLLASTRWGIRDPTIENYDIGDIGFRVAAIPEPGSIASLVCGAVAGLIWCRRRK